jgi:hypothetical protein
MIFSYDSYNKLKQGKLFLANPQKKYIGVLGGVKQLKFAKSFNNMDEISFSIYKTENELINPFYDKIEEKRLIEFRPHMGWFQIQTVSEKNDGLIPYKEISCLSLENELIGKSIYDINGVYSLYDIATPETSLLHIISQQTGWRIGHVDNALTSKWRTFSIDSEKAYNILMTDISKSFECVFQFNTYDKTINAYTLENLGELTDIFITHKNLLKEYILEGNADKIVTKLKVTGSEGVDIRRVNPTGTNYIINIDYYKVPISEGGWMTDELVNALNNYQSAYDSQISVYNSTLSVLQNLQLNLTNLKSNLVDLQSLQKSQEEIIGSYVDAYNGAPPTYDPVYALYLNAINAKDSYVSQIAMKKNEIKSKETEIDTVKNQLNNISNNLDMALYLNQEQLDELNTFLTENEEYQDSTFVITDTMTDDEITEMELELLSNGVNELARVSKPQPTFEITAKNLYTIQDNDRVLSYDKWKEKLDVGNLITIRLRKELDVTVRILKIDFDFENLEEISLTLSNKSRLDDDLSVFEEVLADAGRSASALSLNKFGYDQAAKLSSPVREFINGTLNATQNAMQSNDNQELYIDGYGLHMRKWLPDQNKYSDYQAWWANRSLLFSSDGFKTTQMAVGLLNAPDGNQYYGVAAPVLIGDLIVGSRLNISNNSGTYSISDNGFNAVNGIYSVTINPNAPSEIFKIAVNGSNKLYVDTVSNKLIFHGDLHAASGTFSGTVTASKISASTITGNTITGGVISGTNISGGSITGTTINATTINGGTINGVTISSSFINNGDTLKLSMSDVAFSVDLETSYINVNSILGHSNLSFFSSSNDCAYYGRRKMYLKNSDSDTVFSVDEEGDIICGKINGSNAITVGNINEYKFPPSNHYQDSTTITPVKTNGGNVGLNGLNVASVNWCNSTFQTRSSSDLRLKYNISKLENLPVDLYLALKPWQYKFKTDTYGKGIFLGLFAQQVEATFKRFGYNALDFNLIEIVDAREYTDEGQYVLDGKIHRINYDNFHAWNIYMIQKVYERISNLELKFNSLM